MKQKPAVSARSQRGCGRVPSAVASRRSLGLGPAAPARLLLLALCCMLLVAGKQSADATLSAEAFLASPAAAAFKQGRYQEARAGFEALVAEYPGDALLLRYLGLSHDRLGQLDKAIAAFEHGLEIQPDSPALHYFLGITAFRSRDSDRAFAAFRRAIELAPDSPYGERARRYVAAMQQQIGSYEQPGAPRRWDLFVQLGSQYDWNVQAAPDSFSGDTDGFRFTQFLLGSYDVLQRERWRIRGELSSYHSQHPDSDFDAFDLNTVGTRLELSYASRVRGRPVTTSLGYGWDFTFLDGDRYSSVQRLATRISVGFRPDTLTQLVYEFRTDRFREDGFNRKVSSRDAVVNVVGLSQYLFFDERRHYLWVDYRFRHADADGSNFDVLAQSGVVGASLGLPHRLRADLNVSFDYEKYVHFRGSPDRRSRRWTLSTALSRPLRGGLAVSLGYLYANDDSNYRSFEWDRHLATLTLGNRF